MNKTFVIVLVVIVILVGSYFIFTGWGTPEVAAPGLNTDNANIPPLVGDQPANSAPSVKEFTVSGSNYKFSVTEIRVKQGDTVKVTFKSDDGFHDWALDEFGVKTKQLKTGESEMVEFVADKTGTFEYYCSVGEHREMGMVGKLIVE